MRTKTRLHPKNDNPPFVDKYFDLWGLSSAERAIALLLLAGLSHKQIAAARSTSEATVRQQAAAVYGKAGVDGRTSLSAFFFRAWAKGAA